ncbi:hypothetical protein ABT158_22695 [Nonomuraea sp. NPDC001636]|uniref:hypothetical protein n=1 Tax=Nonomuraea sp. NPDC001636 TaxID=3154391 RepID=UPI00332530A7
MTTTATPVELGEGLLTLLRRADTHSDPRISGGGDTVADHLHAALIALLGTQGWGPAQAAEAIADARIRDCTLGRALLDRQEGTAGPTTVSRAQAEQVVAAIARQFGVAADEPKLMEEWWDGRQWSIFWDGPHEWAFYVPEGGTFPESGWEIPACELPPGVSVEAVNACTLSLQPR